MSSKHTLALKAAVILAFSLNHGAVSAAPVAIAKAPATDSDAAPTENWAQIKFPWRYRADGTGSSVYSGPEPHSQEAWKQIKFPALYVPRSMGQAARSIGAEPALDSQEVWKRVKFPWLYLSAPSQGN